MKGDDMNEWVIGGAILVALVVGGMVAKAFSKKTPPA